MEEEQEIVEEQSTRKSKYKKELCQDVIEMAKSGRTISAFCVKHNISKTSFYEWQRKFKDFKESCDVADSAYQCYWETMMTKAAFKEIDCDSRLMVRMLDHATRRDEKHTPTNITVNNVSLSSESIEDQQRRIKELLQKAQGAIKTSIIEEK